MANKSGASWPRFFNRNKLGGESFPSSQFSGAWFANTGLTSDGLYLADNRSGIGTGQEQPGRCYSFDGSSSKINCGAVNPTGAATIFFRIASSTAPSIDYRLVCSRDGSNNGLDLSVTASGRLDMYNGSTYSSADGAIVFDGTWLNVAMIINSASSAFYINGIRNGSYFNTSLVASSGNMYLGVFSLSDIRFFNGKMSDFRVYDSALTVDDLFKLNNFQNPTTVPMHWQKMDDNHATIAYNTLGGTNGTKTSITHYTGKDVPYSWQNNVGYTLSGGVYIPRNESNTSLDVTGGTLQYSGIAPVRPALINSPCITLNGSTQYGTAPSAAGNYTDNFTVTAWINSASVSGDQRIISKRDSGVAAWEFYVGATGILRMYDGTTIHSSGVINVPVGVWTHVAMRISGATSAFFANGVQTGSNFSPSIASNSIDIFIGRLAFASSGHYNGSMCGLSIYGVALSAGSLEDLANNRPIATVASWCPPISENSGTQSYNVIANSNHVTWFNTPSWATKQSVYHYNIRYGFRKSGSVEIPALVSGVSAADGNAITNPAGKWLNADELTEITTKINFAPVNSPRVRQIEDATQQTIPVAYDAGTILPFMMSKRVATNKEDRFTLKSSSNSNFIPSRLGSKLLYDLDPAESSLILNNSSQPAVDGERILSITDKVQGLVLARQAGSGAFLRTNRLNGKPFIEFDLASWYRNNSSNSFLSAEASGEIFIVFRQTDYDNTDRCAFSCGANSGVNGISIMARSGTGTNNQSNVVGIHHDTSSADQWEDVDYRTYGFNVMQVSSTGSAYTLYRNGQDVVHTASQTNDGKWFSASASTVEYVTVGNRSGGGGIFKGDVARVIITRALNAVERMTMNDYLTTTYKTWCLGLVGDSMSNDSSDMSGRFHDLVRQTYYGRIQSLTYAVGGANTAHIISTQYPSIKNKRFYALSYLCGINDVLTDLVAVDIFARIRSICDDALSRKMRVVLSNLIPFGTYTGWSSGRQAEFNTLNTLIQNYATTTENVGFADQWTSLKDPANSTNLNPIYDSGDGLHPNTNGYDIMAANLYTALGI